MIAWHEIPRAELPDDLELYICIPDNWDRNQPWVLAVHGSGRDAFCFRDIPFYIRQRDLALSAGCAFAAVSSGDQVWGTDSGLDRLLRTEQQVLSLGGSERFAVWGNSAGGSLAFRMALFRPDRVALILGMFPVVDLEAFYENKGLQNGWKGSDIQRVHTVNPLYSIRQLPRIPAAVAHGTDDKVLPPSKHILRVASDYPGALSLYLPKAGHSTESMNLYDTSIFSSALAAYTREIMEVK